MSTIRQSSSERGSYREPAGGPVGGGGASEAAVVRGGIIEGEERGGREDAADWGGSGPPRNPGYGSMARLLGAGEAVLCE